MSLILLDVVFVIAIFVVIFLFGLLGEEDE
jgi:hypothetical protein